MFHFEIEHRKGNQHVNADFLSRLPSCGQCNLKHTNPKNRRNTKLLRELKDCQHFDEVEEMKKLLQNKEHNESIKSSKLWGLKDRLKFINDHLFYESDEGHLQILSEKNGFIMATKYHEFLGHVGYTKLFNTLRQIYFWTSMKVDIYNVCQSCLCCNFRKSAGNIKHNKNNLCAEFPFQKVFVDVTGPLPKTRNGNRYVLGIIDCFSKWIVLVPLKSESAVEIGRVLFKNWIAIFGAPECIHSDRGANFTGDVINSLCKSLKIVKSFTSPYYPQSNGQCERLFRTVKDILLK